MERFKKLLDTVEYLKANRKSGFIGFDVEGSPRFADFEEPIGVFGAPRQYKGSAVIIPSVAVHPGPVIVTSIRSDISEATWNAREAVAKKYGGGVYELDFTYGHTSTQSNSKWSILDGFSSYEQCLQIVNSFMEASISNPEHDHWRESATKLMVAYMYSAKALGQNFTDAVKTIFNGQQGTKNLLMPGVEIKGSTLPTVNTYARFLYDLFLKLNANPGRNGKAVKFESGLEASDSPWALLNSIYAEGATGEQERASIVSFVSRVLMPWRIGDEPELPSFNISEFVRSHSTVYITIPAAQAEFYAPMVVAFISQVEKEWLAINSNLGPKIDAPLLLALDETANVSPIPSLDTLMSSGAGNGIQTITVFQDPNQAFVRWKEKAHAILNATAHKFLLPGINDREFLENIAARSGETFVEGYQYVLNEKFVASIKHVSAERLLSERRMVDEILSFPEGNLKTKQGRLAFVNEIFSARVRDNLDIRPQFKGSTDGAVQDMLTEIYELTDLLPTRDRFTNVKFRDLVIMAKGEGYIQSVDESQSGFTVVEPWFNSSYWKEILGKGSTGLTLQ